jgi:hypothetical protein
MGSGTVKLDLVFKIKTYNNTMYPQGAWWWPVFVQFIRFTVSTSFFICQGQRTNVQMNGIIEKLGGKWIVAHMDLHHVSCTQSFTLTYAGNNLFHALLLFSLLLLTPGTSRKASPWKWMYTIKKRVSSENTQNILHVVVVQTESFSRFSEILAVLARSVPAQNNLWTLT